MPFSESVSRKIPLELSSGGKAAIQGLKNRPDLNGRLVKLVQIVEDGRWKSQLLGDEKASILSVKAENLLPAPPSALLATLPAREGFPEAVVPLACSVGIDGYGNPGVRVMYSEFLGLKALIPAYHRFCGDAEDPVDQEELAGLVDQMFSMVTSPYNGKLLKNECVVVVSKYPDDFDRLIKYQCLEDTGRSVKQGMHRDSRVCRILFPYDIE